MFRTARILTSAALAIALLAAVAGSAAATPPGRNGRITFMRFDANGQFQAWVANPDMSHQVQLTSGPTDAWFPSWSPDGSRIVFAGHRDDPDPTDDVEISDVFTMRPDGSDVRKLTDSVGYSGTASWSPDGRWIVYTADRGDYPRRLGIYLIPANGSRAPRRLTVLPASSEWQELPRFSPDGRSIVFDEARVVSQRQADGTTEDVEQTALITMRADGSHLRRITAWELNASDADWSPDGRRLVFGARPSSAGGMQEVMIASADGGDVRNLSRDHTPVAPPPATYVESFNPAWSPDGQWVVFAHATWSETDFRQGLQLIRPDGSHRSWLSNGEEHQPDWGSARPTR